MNAETPPHQYSKVGMSLGSGSSNSGTFGCFITIDGPNQGTYALTNGHVALPEQWEKKPKAVNDPPPFSIIQSPNEIHQLHQPSKMDVEILIKHLQDDLQTTEGDLERNKTTFHLRRGGSLSGSKFSILESNSNSIRDLQSKIQSLRTFDNKFGIVAFSSGMRFEYASRPNGYGFTMDWALISLDQGRFGNSMVRNSMLPWDISSKQRSVWNRAASDTKNHLGPDFMPALTGTLDIQDEVRKGNDTYVLKRGRSTGYRAGCINEYQIFSQETGANGQELYSTEFAVLNLVRENSFTMKGDSGCVVWNKAGLVPVFLSPLLVSPS